MLKLLLGESMDAPGSPARAPHSWPDAVHGAAASARGFSLVELMVVMMLVTLLFGLVGVSVSRSIGGAEIRAAEREIVAGLRHTRGQAIINRQQQVFTVDTSNRTWTAAGQAPVVLPDGLQITLNTGRSELTGEGAGGIRFFPDGASTGGSIVLTAQEREWHIAVAWLTGEISRDREREAWRNQ